MSALVLPGSALSGTLRFIRYGFMPNRLQYCGGGENQLLFEYGVNSVSDGGLTPLLKKFTGALPYLQLIARANGTPDAFAEDVVDAYWIGNSLLDNVEVRQLYDHLATRFGKQLTGRTRDWVLSKAPAGARPHHSFHVYDIHSRVGDLENSIETMDNCMVSWGTVTAVNGGDVGVDRIPLVLEHGKLALGEPRPMRALRQIDGRGFNEELAVGDTVTIHWGWVCEVIDASQLSRLERYTRHHIALANQTL